MGFNDLMGDVISILRRNGERFEGIRASVQAKGIYIVDAPKILIEAGDLVQRKMSNGGEEFFQVTDPGYYEATAGFNSSYQMKVRKVSEADARQILKKAQNENEKTSMTSDARRTAKYAEWDGLGLERVKADLIHNKGMGVVGGGMETIDLAWEWVRERGGAEQVKAQQVASNDSQFIAASRLDEVRALKSDDYDFVRLIRICEELNSAYAAGSYFSTAALTRTILDHVPPLFGVRNFAEIANNYAGGSRSFKEAMHNLDGASRKISDGHLHQQIRKSETLPVAQQVNFSAQIDLLLSEIVRVYK